MAAEEHAHEEFVGLHNGILEILQVSRENLSGSPVAL